MNSQPSMTDQIMLSSRQIKARQEAQSAITLEHHLKMTSVGKRLAGKISITILRRILSRKIRKKLSVTAMMERTKTKSQHKPSQFLSLQLSTQVVKQEAWGRKGLGTFINRTNFFLASLSIIESQATRAYIRMFLKCPNFWPTCTTTRKPQASPSSTSKSADKTQVASQTL